MTPAETAWRTVLDAGDVPPGALRRVETPEREEAICVARLQDGGLHAFADSCPHRGAPLSEGELVDPEAGVLRCRAHTWEWDVRDGSVVALRAPLCLDLVPVRERDGAIEIAP